MSIKEFTSERAQRLNTMCLPDIRSPLNIKILWFECTKSNIDNIFCEEHSHPFFELHYIFSGESCYDVDGERVTVKENEALLFVPNISHTFIKNGKNFFRMSLAFSFEDIETSKINIPDSLPKKFSLPEDIAVDVDFVLRQCTSDDFFTPTIISNRALEIIYCTLNTLGAQFHEDYGTADEPRIYAAKHYIDSNKHKLITCEDVAKACCLSRKQLNRIFKKHSGQTLYDYLISSRARYAERLVLQAEYSIKEISYMLGFENVNGFVCFFKRYFGLPPKLYRENHNN